MFENGIEDGGFVMFERNIDSKLVVVFRKFEKRVVVRRSIFKLLSFGFYLLKGLFLRKVVFFYFIKLG